MIRIEYHQHQLDIGKYTMTGARLEATKSGALLALQVPGLAERRPSVLVGDKVFARIPGDPREYSGYAHAIDLDRASSSWASAAAGS